MLGLSESSVFKRLQRLRIESTPYRKATYARALKMIYLPHERTPLLAEFFGIMLGDGHVSNTQAVVTLGTKELEYVHYVAGVMYALFGVPATTCIRKNSYRDVYIGSTRLTGWLRAEGLVSNKVAAQVDVPGWVFSCPEHMQAFIRGFFDTDGSVYALRFGIQIEFTNHALPLLLSLQRMLIELGYTPSAVSVCKVYLTRRRDVQRFFSEIRPANQKHVRRYEEISKSLTRR